MIKLFDSDELWRRVTDRQTPEEFLARSTAPTLRAAVDEFVATLAKDCAAKGEPLTPDVLGHLAGQLLGHLVTAGERAIMEGCQSPLCSDARILAAVEHGLQLVAWRTTRDAWLAKHNSSLDGTYLSQRLALELPGYVLCNGVYCQSTKREAPPELAREAARIGGEVRWYRPERRLVAAVKFPAPFKDTEFSRWTIKEERLHFHSSHVLKQRALDRTKWRSFVESLLKTLDGTLEAGAEAIQRHGAHVELRIDVVADDQEA